MDTRDKIIQSAVKLFGEKGYHSTSIQEISQKAGVSKGAVFHYFPNKSELLYVIHDIHIDMLLESAKRILDKNNLTANDKLRELIIDLVHHLADYRLYVLVLLREFINVTDENKLTIIKDKRDMYEKAFHTVIKDGVKNGEFRKDLNIDITVKAIFGMCNWTPRWLNPEGELLPSQIGLIFWDIVKSGLLDQY